MDCLDDARAEEDGRLLVDEDRKVGRDTEKVRLRDLRGETARQKQAPGGMK